ncbi:MAG TPA: ATP-grasp domain-containing protein [bacterium]|jgi:biotin carboxylase
MNEPGSGEWVLVIGAGYWQIPLINTVKRLGYKALTIDRDPDAQGGRAADKFEAVDITDHITAIELGRKYKIAGAVSDQTDISVPTLAKICTELNLPGPSVETAYNTTNKARMRELADKCGVKNPRYRVCTNVEEAMDGAEVAGFPCVVKPTDAQASRGVRKVDTKSVVPEAVEEALIFSKEKRVLVEEYITGTEVTVEGCRYAGDSHLLCTSTKKHTPPPHIIAMNLDFPAQLPDEKIRLLEESYFKMVDALGIQAGSIHGEMIVNDDGVFLVEMANRGGGSGTSSHCVPEYSGVDLLEANVLYAVGKEQPAFRTKNRAGVLRFMLFEPGIVRNISGLDEARKIDGVVATDLYIKAGDELKPATMDTMRHGYIITVADRIEDARVPADAVERTIRVNVSRNADQ